MQAVNSVPAARDLVLIGGGHAHVQVLRSFGMQPLPGVRLTLISPDVFTPYSGMLPGYVAGLYKHEQIHIDLVRLTNFAQARFVRAQVAGLDLAAQTIQLPGRPDIRFDLLSINSGAIPEAPLEDAVTVKPIADFLPKWHAAGLGAQAIVGAGAGGVELALAVRESKGGAVPVYLIGPELLPQHGQRARRLVAKELAAQNIQFLPHRVVNQSDDALLLDSGQELKTGSVFWVTGVRAPGWLADAGLAVDAKGFVCVDQHLRSTSHDCVFAAGDVAELTGQSRPKSGVFAVRAGPALTANLRATLLQQPLKRFRAQRLHLALLGYAGGKALASRGEWAHSGRIWWWLKQKIDLQFMSKFNDLPEIPQSDYALPKHLRDDLPEQTMRCGGCGAKLAAEPLRRVLARLPQTEHAQVRLGIGDDAAQVVSASGVPLLTVDGFRAILDDPYLFGRVATHHSLNDVLAMGATPTAVLALVTVPLMAEVMVEEELYQLLRGVCDVLEEVGAALVGGHSAEGAELSLGLTVMGEAAKQPLTKAGGEPGDRLLLTKPLGTGVVMAASHSDAVSANAVQAVHEGMDQSNVMALNVLQQYGVKALTDVTGFGLAGHLGEMLRASKLGCRLQLDSVPTYTGSLQSLQVTQSSLQLSNEQALNDFNLLGEMRSDDVRLRMLADPQTNGGLLAVVPAGVAAAALGELTEQGYTAADIGELAPQQWEIQ